MSTEAYIPLVIREFNQLKRLADAAIAQLPVDQLTVSLSEGDNSVAVIMKHISGNMRSRWLDFLSTDGEKPDRNRDSEFILFPEDTREKLLAQWEESWAILFRELTPLTTADLTRSVKIRGESITVLQAINRQLTHYAYHVGQIVFLAKHLVGSRWASLSIPVGKSEEFNRAPAKYLEQTNVAAKPNGLPIPEPAAVVQRQFEAYNARNLDVLLASYADDAQLFEHPANLLASGVAAMRERFGARFQETNLHATLLNRIVSGNHVIDHERVTRTFPEGPGTIELVWIYEVQHGRITQAWSIPGAKSLERTK